MWRVISTCRFDPDVCCGRHLARPGVLHLWRLCKYWQWGLDYTNPVTLVFKAIQLVRSLWLMDNVTNVENLQSETMAGVDSRFVRSDRGRNLANVYFS